MRSWRTPPRQGARSRRRHTTCNVQYERYSKKIFSVYYPLSFQSIYAFIRHNEKPSASSKPISQSKGNNYISFNDILQIYKEYFLRLNIWLSAFFYYLCLLKWIGGNRHIIHYSKGVFTKAKGLYSLQKTAWRANVTFIVVLAFSLATYL